MVGSVLENNLNPNMTNLTASGKAVIDGQIASKYVQIDSNGIPNYNAGVGLSAGSFTPTQNGILWMQGNNDLARGFNFYKDANNGLLLCWGSIKNGQGGNTWFIPVLKDQTYYLTAVLTQCRFYPCIGG